MAAALAVGLLASFFGEGPSPSTTLTSQETLLFHQVKELYPDCDSNFIAYLLKTLGKTAPGDSATTPLSTTPWDTRRSVRSANRKPPLVSTSTPTSASTNIPGSLVKLPSSSTAGPSANPGPALVPSPSTTGPAPMVIPPSLLHRIIDKIQAMGELYPREPSPMPDPAEATMGYANYYLDVLNGLFPHWSTSALRDWITLAIINPATANLPPPPTPNSSPVPTLSSQTKLRTAPPNQGPHGLSLRFPDLMADQYFDHVENCARKTSPTPPDDLPRVPSSQPGPEGGGHGEPGPRIPLLTERSRRAKGKAPQTEGPISPLANLMAGASQLFPKCRHLYLPRPSSLRPLCGHLDSKDYFRSPHYREGAYLRLLNAYPQLYKSTIRAVLAENRDDYPASFHQLATLSREEPNSTWLLDTFMRFFPSRPTVVDHPAMYQLDLLRDLEVMSAQTRAQQSERDAQLARDLNESEYTEQDQLISCGCCYFDLPFEELVGCTEGHLCCRSCLARFVREFSFGQMAPAANSSSSSSSATPGPTGIQCIGDSDCSGTYTRGCLAAHLPAESFAQFNEALTQRALQVWQAQHPRVPTARCPYCPYLEIRDRLAGAPAPSVTSPAYWLAGPRVLRILWVLVLATLARWALARAIGLVLRLVPPPLRFPAVYLGALWFTVVLAIYTVFQLESQRILVVLRRAWNAASTLPPPAHGFVQCKNPQCRKLTCPVCDKLLTPDHHCGESKKDVLKRYIEKAMDEAVKRTCPRCQLSFVKSDGCNKMTCRCGYIMCYVCRRDIAKESYTHFCQHFRLIPGSRCTECDLCDLYKCDTETTERQRAADRARREFLQALGSANLGTDTLTEHNDPVTLADAQWSSGDDDLPNPCFPEGTTFRTWELAIERTLVATLKYVMKG
ncbi:hypothetical protein H4R33_001197 [Dimargaris cristalligena]|nr:hypothetical protein H4R33_001197 [Dimargaris cristalligena]